MRTAASTRNRLIVNCCPVSSHHARRVICRLISLAPASGQETTTHKPAAAATRGDDCTISSTSRNSSTPSSSCRSNKRTVAAALAASMAVTALMAAAPTAASASTLAPEAVTHMSSAVPLRSSSVAALPVPEAPALVSDSSEVLLDGMREAVAGGLQEMAASSMTAVGGPVVGESLSAGMVHPSSSSGDSSSSRGSLDFGASTPTAAAVAAAATTAAVTSCTGLETSSADLPFGQRAVDMSFGHQALLCNLWQGYCSALEKSPLLTKVYTGVAGTMLGDLAAQLLSYSQMSSAAATSSRHSSQDNRSKSSTAAKPRFVYDAQRCGRLCLFSAAFGTPIGHYWYAALEALVMPASPTAPAAVAAKVVLDQLLQTPFGMALFFGMMKVMEGRPRDVPLELRTKLVPGLLANWKLWPAAQLVNFMLVPPEQRILFGNIVGVCWTCVISNMQQSTSAGEAEGTSKAAAGGAGDALADAAASHGCSRC